MDPVEKCTTAGGRPSDPSDPSLANSTQDLRNRLRRIAAQAAEIDGKLFQPKPVPGGEQAKEPDNAIVCTVDDCIAVAGVIENELASINERL